MPDYQYKIHCPYFQLSPHGDCHLTKGGLYIPLPQHIEIFCKTEQFTFCPQYLRGHLYLHRENKSLIGCEEGESRRKFQRLKRRIPLFIATSDEKGNPIEQIDDNACTLDVSLAGMKISSKKEIPPHRVLYFRFGQEISLHYNGGIGEVRWATDTPDRDCCYQAGISFLDKTLPAAIGEHLGMTA